MVDNSRVLHNLNMNKRIAVLERHAYAITEPPAPDGRWQTYVKEGDKRRIIRTATYDGLIEKLYDFYFLRGGSSVLSMDALFYEWLKYKECITNSMKTIRRHEQHWNKYFSSWKSEKVTSYDFLELQKQCNLLVRNNNLSSREWQNVKTILSGMFDYATKKHYISENVMRDVKITVKFRQVNKKSGKIETFQTEEYLKLLKYLKEEYSRTGDVALLAVQFDFFVGCRVGELVALKWSDLVDLNHLHICREEIRDSVRCDGKWIDVYAIAEHTKTHSDRMIPLVPDAVRLLNGLRLKTAGNASEDDFIFVRNGERITSRQINYVLEKACGKLGISVKRSHKIRKTVASRLNAGGMPLDFIREFLGHSNLETTLGYIYNPLSDKETYTLMSKAL